MPVNAPQNMQLDLTALLRHVLLPFLLIAILSAISLQLFQNSLPPSLIFALIDGWVFSFGAGLIIIMNMIGYILRTHYRKHIYYWPAQTLLTAIIFVSMLCIILVVSGVVRWHAIKLLSGLISS